MLEELASKIVCRLTCDARLRPQIKINVVVNASPTKLTLLANFSTDNFLLSTTLQLTTLGILKMVSQHY